MHKDGKKSIRTANKKFRRKKKKERRTSFLRVLMKQSIVLLYAESPIILDFTWKKKIKR